MRKPSTKTCQYCGGKHYVRNMCKVHYVRWQKGYSQEIPFKVQNNEYQIVGQDAIVTFYDKKHNPKGTFLISAEDIELIKGLKWYEMNTGYIAAYKKDNNPILLHRYLMDCPDGLVVDHINHNRKDNRRSNLRICTQKENVANTEWKTGQSGVRGIRRDNGFWRVVIKNKYIGCSPDLEEAKRILEEYYATNNI